MKNKIRRVARQLSLPVSALAGALFAAGVIFGLIAYLDRSPVRQKNIPGASAWSQHLVVAAVAFVLFGYAWWRRQRRFGRRSGRLWLLAPFGKPAARRVARTVAAGLGRQPGRGRALLALPPIAAFLYCLARMGEQVTAGLDPNFTINAWGGPTYLGAMACHYLDLLVLMGVAAWMLHLILPPNPANPATDTASRSHTSPRLFGTAAGRRLPSQR